MSLHCAGIFPVLRKLDGCMLVGSIAQMAPPPIIKVVFGVRLWVQKTLGAVVTNI